MPIRYPIHFTFFGVLAFAAACGGSSAPAETTPATTTTDEHGGSSSSAETTMRVQVESHASQGAKRIIKGASATLTTKADGLKLKLDSVELTVGNVYTFLVVAVNDPGACASSPCTLKDILGNAAGVKADVAFGAGAIADDEGRVSMVANMPVGEWEKSWFTGGLTAPTTAEIHVVLNDHGPIIEGREETMLTSYRDGCNDESLPPPFPDTAKSDGEPGPNTCALTQVAIFIQGK